MKDNAVLTEQLSRANSENAELRKEHSEMVSQKAAFHKKFVDFIEGTSPSVQKKDEEKKTVSKGTGGKVVPIHEHCAQEDFTHSQII